jgi:hypothetical protein
VNKSGEVTVRNYKPNGWLALLLLGAVVAFSVACNSCNVVSNIPGNVAGQIMNEAGQGRGFVSVQLVDTATGIAWGMENADDTGNYMFKNVDTGTYIIKVISIGGGELPSNAEEFRLSPGKTLKQDIIIYDNPPEEEN